jgi:hypothetical protein
VKLAVVLGGVVLAATACGGSSSEPRIAHADAASLIALAHRIGHESTCAQAEDIPKLRARAIALVNHGKVPAALQERLIDGVNALGGDLPICLPSVQAAPTTTAAETSTRVTRVAASHAHPRGKPHPPKQHPHPHPHPPKPHKPGKH